MDNRAQKHFLQKITTAIVCFMLFSLVRSFPTSPCLHRSIFLASQKRAFSRKMISVNSDVPTGIIVDVVESTEEEPCKMNQAQDLGELLKSHSKAILFGVPGAFTPTCSAQHLPGFISNVEAITAKGVEAIYCLSVNDRFVMKAWAESTPGCAESGIKLVADGNGEYTASLGLVKDGTGSRMGLRCKRFAAIIDSGKISVLNVDEKGMAESSAETMLQLLG